MLIINALLRVLRAFVFTFYSSADFVFAFSYHITTKSSGHMAVKSDLTIRTKDNYIVHSHRHFT